MRMEHHWKKPLRIISKVIITFLATFILLVLALAFFIFFRQDSIMRYALEHINKRLRVQITVQHIDVKFFQTFPNVTLTFENVYVPEANVPQPDTLVYASAIRFHFNLFQLLRGNYVVRRIQIIDGICRIKMFQNGENNFQIWKTDTSDKHSPFTFDVQSFQLKNVLLAYHDFPLQLDIATSIERGHFKGNFSDSTALLKYSVRGLINNVIVNKDTLLWNKNYMLAGDIRVSDKYQSFQFNRTNITFQKVHLQFEGNYRKDKYKSNIDVHLTQERALLSDVLELFPVNVQNKLSQFIPSGYVKLSIFLKGQISDQQLPSLEVLLDMSNATLTQIETKEKIKNITCNIRFYCPDLMKLDHSSIDCKQFRAEIGRGSIESMFTVSKLKNSTVQFTLSGELDLNDFHEIFSLWEGLEVIEGMVVLKMNGILNVSDILNIQMNELYDMKLNGQWNAESVNLIFKNNPEPLRLSAVQISVGNQILEIKSMRLFYGGSDFILQGKCIGMSDYLAQRKKFIHIEGTVRAQHLNLMTLFAIDTVQTGKQQSDTLYQLTFPTYLTANIVLSADNLFYDRFDAKRLSARLTFADNVLIFRDIDVMAFDGRLNGEVMIDARRENIFSFNVLARVHDVNIQKTFYQLNNFGQNSLTDKHLNGRVQGIVHFSSKWNRDLTVDLSSISVVADLTINNGVIRNYPPLEGLKKYFRRRDFSYVTFDRLHNEIQINDRMITIPRMTIKSNVMDFEMEGTHSFDNNIDYRFQIMFSELLGGEQKQREKVEEEYGNVVQTEKGPAWFFRVTGTVDDPKFVPLDFQTMRQQRKEKIQQEKEQVRQVIQQEFSSAQRQSERVLEHKSNEKKKVTIEWSDE